MQTTLDLTTPEATTKAWAFAMPGKGTNRRRIKSLSNYVITSCSQEAKRFGIQVGMKYEDAKLMLPELKILAIGSRRVRSN